MFTLDLQLLAEGAAPAAEAGNGEVAAPAGENGQDAADNQLSREARFEQAIKGDYKDLFDARVQSIVKDRLKNSKDAESRLKSLSPTLDMLGRKYGVDVNDVNALNKAIEDDNSFYEDEALEKGLSVEQLKEIRKVERENAELKAKMQEAQKREQADRIYAGWLDQAEKAKVKYPNLDLSAELQNGQFVDLLRAGVDVEAAYTVVHKDEIIGSVMQFANQKGEEKVAASVRANGMRPVEGAMKPEGTGSPRTDPASMTKEQREELIRRSLRGEKISF